MTKQTEAQRLAADLSRIVNQFYTDDQVMLVPRWTTEDAAVELRRLDAENAALRDALRHIEGAAMDITCERQAIRSAARAALSGTAPARCEYCDGTGDVTSQTGEWRGRCVCPAGTAPARVPLTDEQAKDLLRRSDLLDMFLHIGWYSAPRKGFDEHALSLIRAIEAAHGITGDAA